MDLALFFKTLKRDKFKMRGEFLFKFQSRKRAQLLDNAWAILFQIRKRTTYITTQMEMKSNSVKNYTDFYWDMAFQVFTRTGK